MFNSFPFKRIFSIALSLGAISIVACKDPEPGPTPGYQVPTTYNFSNVNYTGQSQRLSMLGELVAYGKTANTGASVDKAKLLDMYRNTNNPFANAALNT